MLPGGRDTSYHNAELTGPADATREQVLDFAAAAGLGDPATAVDGGGIARIFSVLLWLPFAVTAVYVLIRFLIAEGLAGWRRPMVIFGLLLVLALALPALLDAVPVWAIPSKWSDFAFWDTLGKRTEAYFTEWLLMRPYIKDAQAKSLMLQAGCAAALTLCLLPLLYGRVRSLTTGQGRIGGS